MLILNTSRSDFSSTQTLAPAPVIEGTDLKLDSQGEFLVTDTGDLSLEASPDSIITSLIRRVTTPFLGYERLAFNNGGNYELVDQGWSDPLIDHLSAPLTNDFINWAVTRLNEVVAKDPRIIVLGVEIVKNAPYLQLAVYYTLNSSYQVTSIDIG